MSQTPIPFPQDTVGFFAALRARWSAPVWLDGAAGGRYSIISAAPREQLISRHGLTWQLPGSAVGLQSSTLDLRLRSDAVCLGGSDPLALLSQRLGPALEAPPPFASGAIGYFSYELGRRLQGQQPADAGMPEMAVGLYDWAIVIDHDAACAWLTGAPPSGLEAWLASSPAAMPEPWQASGVVTATPDVTGYASAFSHIKSYLKNGDCYQVNYARRLQANFAGDPLGVYADFRELAGGPFAAYLDLPGGPILSGSPERFLAVRDGAVETRPIKGTRARGINLEADRAIREALGRSEKDRAENLMIVDLLRNDLGRCCATGSVRVPKLFALETYATVHHMVSVIEGELDAGCDATDLLRECLPGGSITGAPKYRAMKIIEELEDAPRGIYCGAIGYLGADGTMDTNIAIRTMTARDGILSYHAGGGLVFDSDPQAEFQETESKALAFRQLIQAGAGGMLQSSKTQAANSCKVALNKK